MTGLRLFKIVKQPNVQRAQRRAERLFPRSKGFQAAYLKGWKARRAGRPPSACPYTTRPHGQDGGGTWTWAWRSAWFQGHYEGATTETR